MPRKPTPRHLTKEADWFKDVLKYCGDVLEGRRLASQTEKGACRRFLTDFESAQNNADYPYRFSFAKAAKVIDFIQALPHVKGHWVHKRGKESLIKLESWQKFIIANIFGFVRKADNLRRFSKVFIEVPRKNGKSVLAAGIGLYMLCADGEAGAEIYCGAGSLKQANEVFSPASQMAKKTPALRHTFTLDVRAKSILRPDGSKFEPVIGSPGDGASPSCAIVDEYHEHPDDALLATMETGTGARQQPLILIITTAGENLFVPCYELHKDMVSLLTGGIQGDEYDHVFSVIYGIDPGDDWLDPEMLRKANPNYGVSVNPLGLEQSIKVAKNKPAKQNEVKTKHFNVWCFAKTAYFNSLSWAACYDPAMNEADFIGQSCWIGLDLAKKRDLSARARVFKRDIDGKAHYYVFMRFWLPEDTVTNQEDRELANLYQSWVNSGDLVTCDGNEMDFSLIRDDVIDDSHHFDVVEIPHDPHNATMISHELQNAGLKPVLIPQHGKFLTIPINELEAAIDSGRLHHDGNKVMAWNVANTIVREFNGGNKMPDKESEKAKIDGVSALLDAFARCVVVAPEQEAESEFYFG